MKGDTFPPGTERPSTDPHASKVSPDEARLPSSRPRGRTLRKAPMVLLLVGVLGVLLLAIGFALQPQAASKAKPEASAVAFAQAPVVPDVIRMGPAAPSAAVVPVAPRPAPWGAAVRTGPSEPPRPSTGTIVRALRQRAQLEQDQKAASGGILFDAKGAALAQTQAPAGAPAAPSAGGAGPATTLTRAGGGNGTEPLGDSDPNRQDRKNAFLDAQGASKTTDYLLTSVQHPRSPFELKAGSIIPAVLVTGINSDLPGPVIGQVRENVYDTVTGNYLLIPQGSRLLATYDSLVSWGQERVLVCWNRLIFPDGDSVNLQCMPASDLEGAAGLTDDVNEHWWRLLKGAAIASLLAATSTGLAGNVNGYNPTVPQMWASGGAGEINQVGQALTRRDLNVQPTITVRPGWSLNVLVTKDVILPPYRPARGAQVQASPLP
jgi:type IV secretion system protein VirB10